MADKEWTPMAMVFDKATRQRIASVVERLPQHIKGLHEANVDSPKAAEAVLRVQMERLGERACELIATQPPRSLLGYVWSMRFLAVLSEMRESGNDYRPDKITNEEMQFVLEYMHAAWSSAHKFADDGTPLDEAKVGALFETLEELRVIVLLFGQMSASASTGETGNRQRSILRFLALGAWSNLRGRRHQVLEREFLAFLLNPHDAALRGSYGMGADAIAAGVQAMANSTREGLAEAAETLNGAVREGLASVESGSEVSTEKTATIHAAIDDLMRGGICSLSRHTELTIALLDDISYLPGENNEFLAPGDFRATPLRAMPGLIKPGIKLGEEYYVTDGQFVRDVAYRTIQRGLLSRDPGYREEWNQRQQRLMESAFTTIFARQLRSAKRYGSAYYREAGTGNWAETDLVVVYEDVLVIVEAKAGVMPMHSPAADFDRHMKRVEGLIVGAYRQCARFMQALMSAESMTIYELRHGKHKEVAALRAGDFRSVLAIGLTVEAMSPFSTCLSSLDGIEPLPGGYAFMSMSVDDLQVLDRFLRTTGELSHYLEVRQHAVRVPDVIIIDEMEYLGAYIVHNRFDRILENQRANRSGVVWNSYADVVDQYFEGQNAGEGPVPRQEFPAALATVLAFLDRKRPRGWLEMDAAIRDLNAEKRNTLSRGIEALKKTLHRKAYRQMLVCDGTPIQVWVCRSGKWPSRSVVDREARLACLMAEAPYARVLRLAYKKRRKLTGVICASYATPDSGVADYEELMREASARSAGAMDGQPRGSN